jgi:eukaryotic-like serine/threonine-protein kinase
MASDVFGIVGTTVAGAFEVEAVVAEGGFAVVYRALHSGFKAPVALKCLKIPQYFTPEEQQAFREQFQAEAELLFKLSASISTIVRPLHVEAVLAPDGTFMPFLALEWLEGETLERYVRRRIAAGEPPPTLEEVAELLTPVAKALERAHRFAGPDGPVSIVHRDMKPENIFVARIGDEEVVKILDFGIAKVKSVASQVAGRMSRREADGESFSPAYAAPEQWAPKRYGQTGPWTDVWGLALTTVEVLVGRPIIDGDNAAMMGTTLDEQRRPTPRAEGILVPNAVEAVFARALALDPRDRYADAGVFWGDLRAAIGLPPTLPHSRGSGEFRQPAGASGRLPGQASAPMLLDGASADVPDLDLGPAGASIPASRSSRGPRRPSGSMKAVGGQSAFDLAPEAPVKLELAVEAPPDSSATEQDPRSLAVPLADEAPRTGSPVGEAFSSRPPDSLRRSDPFPQSSRSTSGQPAPQPPPFSVRQAPSIASQLMWPGGLLAFGVLLTVGSRIYATATGEIGMLGPIRLTWIAALAAISGIIWAAYRLVDEAD